MQLLLETGVIVLMLFLVKPTGGIGNVEWVSEWVGEWVSEWVSEWVIDWLIDWVSVCVAPGYDMENSRTSRTMNPDLLSPLVKLKQPKNF